ncbi:hypothetical protein K661_02962 [Piscirickettsia salmonis LF-89 = ATCC VR-1361]|nr:hypothetical protein K661_02962 [Piscirickettsia salmonis LF-89 = ATCC VR-1361]
MTDLTYLNSRILKIASHLINIFKYLLITPMIDLKQLHFAKLNTSGSAV